MHLPTCYFYPRPPCGGRPTRPAVCQRGRKGDFYPRPPCGGRLSIPASECGNLRISIHALRAEGDDCPYCTDYCPVAISIHALRAEGDVFCCWIRLLISLHFYPRPPCGGRPCLCGFLSPSHDFYPRPPCGGRRKCLPDALDELRISIHALRAEGDCAAWPRRWPACDFYPRPPCGGRQSRHLLGVVHTDFYPRPPCGGRPVSRSA